ncbi:MAG TPA: hypothetical protein DD381_05075 [Lentisphaeria bacterium]|nr:MAG: hypothetical protein A2X47_06340 [Lentisphaerae bacterium GWF2_38_69]HBM15703.1 hypothetical protein [Lentisphaeria bacterium]
MKIALFSDIHGRTQYIKSLTEEIKSVDLVVVCGDITHFGNTVAAQAILNSFSIINNKLLAVAGNCELPEVEESLRNDEIQTFCGINFICIGGSLITPSKTPNEHYESYYEQLLNLFEEKLIKSETPLILISHQPPYGTINDKLPTGLHVGSKSIRRFIERVKPIACLTGHIHEGKGCDIIGTTKIINPGPFSEGYYAIIEIPYTPCEVRLEMKRASL